MPSSSGWRSTSSTCRRNSGSSSRKSTPWWAIESSPGRVERAAADQPGVGDGVVRRAEGSLRHQRLPVVEQPHHRVDLRDLERLAEAHRAGGSSAAAARASSSPTRAGRTSSRCARRPRRSRARSLISRWPRTSLMSSPSPSATAGGGEAWRSNGAIGSHPAEVVDRLAQVARPGSPRSCPPAPPRPRSPRAPSRPRKPAIARRDREREHPADRLERSRRARALRAKSSVLEQRLVRRAAARRRAPRARSAARRPRPPCGCPPARGSP